MKKLKGFTLIELIVVIAIIGVLAAILVPAMMGWVIKSRVTTYNNNASEICTQLQVAMTDLDSSGVGSIDGDHTLTFDGSNFTLTGATLKPEVEDVLKNINKNLTDMSHAQWSASITNSTITAVTFTDNDCRHVGGFPVQCPPDFECLSSDVSSYLNNARSGWKTAAK